MVKMICKCEEGSFSGRQESIKWGPIVFSDTIGNITIKVQKQVDWDDWVVRWFIDGKYNENKSSFNLDSKINAIDEAKYIVGQIKLGRAGYSGRIVNEDLAKASPCKKVESVRFFKKGIAGSLNKDQIENYCFEKD